MNTSIKIRKNDYLILFTHRSSSTDDFHRTAVEARKISDITDRVQLIIFLSERPAKGIDFAGCELWIQSEAGDLGQRMSEAMTRAFNAGAGKVVMADVAASGFTADEIQTAFQRLESVDVVLGPTKDGGVYIFGAKRLIPQLLSTIDWSRDKVFNQILKSLCSSGVSIRLLEGK